jgi:hypothetical protein
MVNHQGGRWDVGTEGNAVYLERISESDERLFEDSMSPEEARALAGLLTKYADKAEASEDSGKPKPQEDSGKSDEDSEKSGEGSEKSGEGSEKSDEDSEKSEEESDESEDGGEDKSD